MKRFIRTTLLTAAIAFLVLFVYSLVRYVVAETYLNRLYEATPINEAVDLSRPCTLTFTMTQQYARFSSIEMCINYTENDKNDTSLDHKRIAHAVSDNLRGRLSVRDVNGILLATEALQPMPYSTMHSRMFLCPFFVPALGVYRLTLNVDRGAAILSNIPHRITVIYNPGGGDLVMAPIGWRYASIFSASFAGILLLACFLIWARRAKSASQ